MYKRLIEDKIKKDFFGGRVIVVVGARRVGKTTLMKILLQTSAVETILSLNADNPADRSLLEGADLVKLREVVGGRKILFIDEAQKIDKVGDVLKLLVDDFGKEKQIVVTGSSSINLLDMTSEPLTGRKYVYFLFPLSFEELYNGDGLELERGLDQRMIYGSYPEVVNVIGSHNKERVLRELASSYLYKDILEFQEVKSSSLIYSLLKALALQIGSEVSYSELANLLGIDKKTVIRYIDLLEKSFVIFRMGSYSGNKRREISKNKKVYFCDNGIRNAVLENFNELDSRDDLGALWENLLISERQKYTNYHDIFGRSYFWRTYDGSEVDLVEERGGKLFGFEIKYKKGVVNVPAKWSLYKNASWEVVNKDKLKGFVV
ncbi:ATPase [Candidatus Collierbacteria bacterium CG_4_10_14_0_8_um_filter_43_86]|uniref:ATPase n=1 Tax=Candidatus Collierbacteria bacterium CG_4_9_14_3_um_filter_43_16 TaxID=1974532 RepID=A0A2M8BSZ8_9BACT|nr:MAG: ATPase [Candidatus Collierbacteria bacterium CG_4_10_14_0_8_um_filter_43_86]PJB46970.1 MAG: ATPase [Candidatus Collierbacteria bacterium CG_4_9_14_3_um_filter_43_16]